MINLLAQSKLPSPQSWRACETILQACLHRKSEAGWSVPQSLASALRDIQGHGEQQANGENKDAIDDIQKIIRLLAPTSATTNPPATDPNSSNESNGAAISRPQDEARTYSLLPADNTPPKGLHAPTRPRAEVNPTPPTSGIAIRGAQNAALAGPSTSTKRPNVAEESPRSPKRTRKSDGNADGPPSLLSRLADTNGSSAQQTTAIPSKRRNDHNKQLVAAAPRHDTIDLDEVPVGGFSIRGAANRNEASSSLSMSRSSSSSLLDRMKGADISPRNERGSWKKRKRGRA